ncbi:MAG TPA: PA2169 family four-helix-bundle protein [Alphaproteobacteria bacterium]
MDNVSAATGQATTRGGQSVISVLQDLSARCHDSEIGYRRAAEDARDADLRQQFDQLANERSSMAAELDRLIREQGGEPTWTEGTMVGAAHRMWTDLRTAMSRNHRQAVLEEVARGESAAEEAYDEALSQDLPDDVRRIVQQQHRRVRETRNRYRAMSGTTGTRRTGELAHRMTAGTGAVSQYMYERPVMSSLVVFALGFAIGALTVSTMMPEQPSRRRYW